MLQTLTKRVAAVLVLCAVPALGAASEPTPVYPSATSVPKDREGTITLPGLSGESEQFQFALKDSASSLIDTQTVMDAADELLAGTGLKLAVAVDQEPVSVSSVGQLIRGMLLFGPIDALSEDWLEHGKTRGYVGEDWVVIGIILPESGHGEVQVGVDLGPNVKSGLDESRLAAAGAAQFASGQHTEGVIKTIESVLLGVDRTVDYAKYVLLGLGVLITAIAGIVIIKTMNRRRRNWQKSRREQTLAAAEQIGSLAERIERIGQPLQVFGNPVSEARAWLDTQAPALVARARAAAGLAAGTTSTAPRASVVGYAAKLQDLCEVLDELDSWRRADQLKRSLRLVQTHHREQLAAIPQLLDDSRGRIENAQALRELVVEHTDSLEALNISTASAADGGVFEQLWVMRRELDMELERALPGSNAESVTSLRRGELSDPDIYEKFVALIRSLKSQI